MWACIGFGCGFGWFVRLDVVVWVLLDAGVVILIRQLYGNVWCLRFGCYWLLDLVV